jgi:hypothetical protein
VKKKPVKPYLRKIIKWPICRKALSMRRVEDGKNKNLGIAGPIGGKGKNPTGTKPASSAFTGRQGESSQVSDPKITAP